MSNLITIGCKSWPTLDKFNDDYRLAGSEHGYSDDETSMVHELVNSVMKRMAPVKKTIKITHNGTEIEIDLDKAKELGIIK